MLSVQVTTEGKTQGLAKAEGNYFYLKDSLGTITDITDSLGNLVQHFVYSPFGEIIKVTNKLNEDISSDWNIRTSYTFTNREYDEESGLYYYRARYYDASTGRFLQVDPDPGNRWDPLSYLSKFNYVENNPIVLIDPEGHSAIAPSIPGTNYCGEDKYGQDSSGNPGVRPPVNKLDAACRRHDYAYTAALQQHSWRSERMYAATTNFDLAVRSLISIPSNPAYAFSAVMVTTWALTATAVDLTRGIINIGANIINSTYKKVFRL